MRYTLRLLPVLSQATSADIPRIARDLVSRIVTQSLRACMHPDTLTPLQFVSGMAFPLYTLNMPGIHRVDVDALPPDPSATVASCLDASPACLSAKVPEASLLP